MFKGMWLQKTIHNPDMTPKSGRLRDETGNQLMNIAFRPSVLGRLDTR